jgi:hypothetical protein
MTSIGFYLQEMPIHLPAQHLSLTCLRQFLALLILLPWVKG